LDQQQAPLTLPLQQQQPQQLDPVAHITSNADTTQLLSLPCCDLSVSASGACNNTLECSHACIGLAPDSTNKGLVRRQSRVSQVRRTARKKEILHAAQNSKMLTCHANTFNSSFARPACSLAVPSSPVVVGEAVVRSFSVSLSLGMCCSEARDGTGVF
jgi:hypothetical protein